MAESGQLDDKIAELLALLNAPDGKVLDTYGDAESEPAPEDSMPDQTLSEQTLPDQTWLADPPPQQQLADSEETRFAKYVAAIMQRRKA